MSKKQDYVYGGFGFPITVLGAPMVKFRGELVPKINYDDLAKNLLYKLALKDSRLTGNEIRFIRQFHKMTLTDFGKEFQVSHAAVIKWEQAGDAATKMPWVREKDIRFFALSSFKNIQLWDVYKEFREEKKSLMKYVMPRIDIGKNDHVFA